MMTEEERRLYNKKYYKKNKTRILDNYSKKVKCKCGKIVSRGNYFNHIDTSLHKRRLELSNLMQDEE